MYIDSHAHLEGHKFDHDRAEVFERARDATLERILAIGSPNRRLVGGPAAPPSAAVTDGKITMNGKITMAGTH